MDRAMRILVMFVTITAIYSITRHRLVVRIHPSSLPPVIGYGKPIRTCLCSSLQIILWVQILSGQLCDAYSNHFVHNC